MTMAEAHGSTHEVVAGKYRLLDVVHRETYRVSWYGEDTDSGGQGRPCLVTRTRLPPETGEEDMRRAAERVVRMSRTMARLCPGRIAAVLDAVVERTELWTVTEWIDGRPLGQLLEQEGAFHPVRAAAVGLEVLEVLEAAHAQGITHGELSPGQVFVREQGPVVLTGFGLAGAGLVPRVAAPSYASPEQARDERIGPAADLWALGAMLYAMVEGRPPYRDRDRPGATLRGVDRLPLRTPLRAGPLGPTVQGLLRKDSRERPNRAEVRAALARVLDADPHALSARGLRRAYGAVRRAGPRRGGRVMAVGTVLAVVTVAVAALAVTRQLPGTDDGASDGGPGRASASSPPAPSPSAPDASASAPATPATPPAPSTPSSGPSASTGPAPAPSGGALPAGFTLYRAPEGFSVALPDGWRRLDTARQAGLAYRVTFGARDDPRTLAVTYSERVGPDPVAVWREDVEPLLRRLAGFRRLGEIRATTYQGYRAADMEWLTDVDGTRVRTLGRGFLLGGHRGFSLRWTTPAGDWDRPGNEQALATVLRTFRPAGT
ncbi:protein kinase [Streptomyces longwoodensis]|uniref:serine/threonine-protein kinase n=1 Tax=Streptomyces longwoodensis TaxID=68231 RepID=UPI003851391B